MKTTLIKTAGLFLFLCVCGSLLPLQAGKSSDFVTITGVVKDSQSRKTLEYVNISVPGTSIGTVSNAEGGFAIKVPDSIQAQRIEISYLGYMNQLIPIRKENMENITVYLRPNTNTLPEVTVHAMNPLKLVQEASKKITQNHSASPNLLTGFYRETVRKRRNYINVTEAVINIYKTPYSEDVDRDRVQVFKGRQLVSPKTGDTLVIKLQGGPTAVVYGDVTKNRDLLLGEDVLKDYKFKMETPVMLDKRPHYVVSFEPQAVHPYPLFYGKLYIDEASLSFTQAELNYNMKDRHKITNAILKKKPFNLRFKPEELTYLVTYKYENGVTYLNYMRNEIKFKCDWKRRLFSTNYSVVYEMVVTDKRLNATSGIPSKEAFKTKSVLSDNVGNFYDENFWEGYNIIAPTESLESAVDKLKKQHRK